jgi:hypothetical protein
VSVLFLPNCDYILVKCVSLMLQIELSNFYLVDKSIDCIGHGFSRFIFSGQICGVSFAKHDLEHSSERSEIS